MTHRGPFQPQTFCDSVEDWWGDPPLVGFPSCRGTAEVAGASQVRTGLA